MLYRHIASGQIFAIPRSGAIEVAGQQVGPHTSEAALLALGCEVYIEPPPPAAPTPTLAELKAAVLSTYRTAAGSQIDANVPQPWDRLKDVASVEFREWVDGYLAAVAAELARLEDTIAAAATASELNAIAPDWPEVS